MKLVKVAAAALNQTPLAWDANKANILGAIEAARAADVSLLCLPELCITGYGCEDAFLAPGTSEMAQRVLLEILPHTTGMIVSLGLPVLHGGGLINCAALVASGELLGLVGKQNLAREGIHYEPRWFTPWPSGVQSTTEIDGRTVAIGDLVFDCGGVVLGFEICEDAWVLNRPGERLAEQGADVLLNPSASHFAFGKQEIRRRFVLEGARTFNVSYLYSNLLGNEAGRAIYDGGTMIASGGKLLAEAARFSFADYHITTATIDIDATRMARTRTSMFRPQRAAIAGRVHTKFAFPACKPTSNRGSLPAWDLGNEVKEEEFARGVSLALFDYLRKSRAGGFVVSISGGADSAAVATLVALLVQFGEAELGLPGLLAKLSHLPKLAEAASSNEVVERLLSCVYQSTRNSSDTTRNAARTVTEALGAKFYEFDVERLVNDYVSIVSQAVGRELTWERDDLALQNIQARGRSPGVWLLANLTGSLLLATSNRSEAAVGYATLDGDTSGGLSPIAGIDKAFLRRWLQWMETTGPTGLQPLAALAQVNVQSPTAELRPQASMQTDEADLMPYDLLDAIERAAIRDKHNPLEAFHLMEPLFPQYDRKQLAAWVERFFRLWCRNQWKRERYAPSFHLDDENLDPKTWCRFPILSGGFERELAELREAVGGA
jgi:NAD+ synthase (glutamine-hydrolysing)